MKTTKLILSIALVALATTSFGQLSSNKERSFNKQNHKVKYLTTDYCSKESSRIESWMHDLRSWSNNRAYRNTYIAPVVTRTIRIEQADVLYEEDLGLENWMTTPFECCVNDESGFAEEELSMEIWMITPFESSNFEEELILESWMTTPFLGTEAMEVEEWMTTVWI
ncbi:MAG: hypothetical protein ABFS38_00135 [Bacteroidota bacterium]